VREEKPFPAHSGSEWPQSNLNALLDENLRDPFSGNAVLSGVPVRLEPDNA
jgi:hypothetical protein